jgi:hypothetical protein
MSEKVCASDNRKRLEAFGRGNEAMGTNVSFFFVDPRTPAVNIFYLSAVQSSGYG